MTTITSLPTKSKSETIAGNLDRCEVDGIFGWAACLTAPSKILVVEILADGERIARVVAGVFREELPVAELGNGKHGFAIALPEFLLDGKEHVIEVRETSTGFVLPGSPKIFHAIPELNQTRKEYNHYLPIATERIAAGRCGELILKGNGLWLPVSENCNLRCIGCDDAVWGFHKEYLSPEEVRDILCSGGQRLEGIDLTGGEAMLHPQLCEVIDVCKEIQPEAEIGFYSNGTIPIKGRYREALKKIDTLVLSIDGATKRTFEKIRVGANFEKFIANVKDIVALRKETGSPAQLNLAFTACALNLHELSGVIELAAELGIHVVEAKPMEMAIDEIRNSIGHLHLDKMDPELRTRLVDQAQARAAELGVQFGCAPGLYPELADDAKIDYEYHVRMCQYPYVYTYGIAKQGRILGINPCCFLPRDIRGKIEDRYGFGDARGRSVEQIFNSPSYWQFRKDLMLGKTRDLCGDCSASRALSPNFEQIKNENRKLAGSLPALHLLELGEQLFFTSGAHVNEKYLLEGWSTQESTHRWTEGGQASLQFLIPEIGTSNIVLRVECSGFLANGKLAYQTVDLLVNDQKVTCWEVSSQAWHEAIIPNELIKNGEMKVTLLIGDPLSPFNEKMSGDTRKLGVAFNCLEVVAVDNK